MTESEIRELCNRFFDAYQDRRVDELAEIYAPTTASSGTTCSAGRRPRQENLSALPESYTGQRRRTYNDRTSTSSTTAS